jgi:hypothetical protein
MPPSPSVVSADLATAALQCQALDHARRLAQWVGAGKELTARGVPKPAAAAEACRELGIALPGARLRSALDVDELMVAWVAAVRAGFVVQEGRRARIGPGVRALDGAGTLAHPRLVLDAWLAAVAGEFGVPDDPCAGCLTVLYQLRQADRPMGLGELAEALTVESSEGLCPDCGGVHDPLDAGMDVLADEMDGLEHVGGAVASLIAFGGAVLSGDQVSLTPLGAMLATSVFEGCAPAPDADAKTLLTALCPLPPQVALMMAGPWLAARPAETAVRELLTFAESASGADRVAALAVARTAGPEPVAAWRQWAGRPGFGAYARQWLAEHGKPVAVHPEDEAWLVVDAFSAMLDGLRELDGRGEPTAPVPLDMALGELGEDPDEVLAMLRESGHPAADEVAAWLDEQFCTTPEMTIRVIPPGQTPPEIQTVVAWPPPGTPAKATVCQLRISLRYVDDPPVWRRVLVPATYTLDHLHHVIQLAMGWEHSHLHMFSTRLGEYGVPDPDLECGDQTDVTVADVLPRKRSTLVYTYDFGDGWEHDVVVEDKRPVAPDDLLPSCVAGEGACPPEDCGGPWGYADLKEILADPDHEEHFGRLDWMGLDEPGDFDAAAFCVDEANKRFHPRG